MTLLLCLILGAVCFACGYMTGYDGGWWNAYTDFVPRRGADAREEVSGER